VKKEKNVISIVDLIDCLVYEKERRDKCCLFLKYYNALMLK